VAIGAPILPFFWSGAKVLPEIAENSGKKPGRRFAPDEPFGANLAYPNSGILGHRCRSNPNRDGASLCLFPVAALLWKLPRFDNQDILFESSHLVQLIHASQSQLQLRSLLFPEGSIRGEAG
jgi:hypothetical protein